MVDMNGIMGVPSFDFLTVMGAIALEEEER